MIYTGDSLPCGVVQNYFPVLMYDSCTTNKVCPAPCFSIHNKGWSPDEMSVKRLYLTPPNYTAKPTIMSSATSSTTTLVPPTAKPSGTTKDYNAALGALQSNYGFGGHFPAPNTSHSKPTTAATPPGTKKRFLGFFRPPHTVPATSHRSTRSVATPPDRDAALLTLMDKYPHSAAFSNIPGRGM